MFRSPDRRWAALLAVLGGGAVVSYYLAASYVLGGRVGFPLDDSWIHLQFARNLAQGVGLAYNPGVWMTGSTSPLWTCLLSLGFLLPGGAFLWARLLGAALYLATGWAAYRLAREIELSPVLARVAAGLTLATSWLVWSALSAMEVPLFTFLTVLAIALHVRERREPERPSLSLGLMGLAVLARPEGFLLLALALLDRWLVPTREGGRIRLRRVDGSRLAAGALLVAVAAVPAVLFYWYAGGSPLPTTFTAKTGGGLHRLVPSLRYIRVVLDVLLGATPIPTLLAAAGVTVSIMRWGGRRDAGLLPAAWTVALPLGYALLSPPGTPPVVGNFGRYFFPLFPLIAVFAVLALSALLERAETPIFAARAWRALGLLIVCLPTVVVLARGALVFARNVGNVEDSDVAAAHWLQERLPADALLAVNDVGALKYMLPNRVLDMAGIVSPEISDAKKAAVARGENWQQGVVDVLAKAKPDYAVVFPNWYPGLVGPDKLLQPIHVIRIRGNITMGGDVIAICRTPWTMHPLAEPDGNGE